MKGFPNLKETRHGYVNLNDASKDYDPTFVRETQLEPGTRDNIVTRLQHTFGTNVLVGGFLEKRSDLLADTYLADEQKFIHLGVDVWVPAGTEVAVVERARVIRIDCDTPEKHGWGTTVAVDLTRLGIVLLYGHLAKEVHCRPGDILEAGQIFATIGDHAENGGWYPHLHAQAMLWKTFQQYTIGPFTWKDLDGYGKEEDLDIIRAGYRDPTPYLGLHD